MRRRRLKPGLQQGSQATQKPLLSCSVNMTYLETKKSQPVSDGRRGRLIRASPFPRVFPSVASSLVEALAADYWLGTFAVTVNRLSDSVTMMARWEVFSTEAADA